MKCKNCGKETRVRMDDGPGASHVEEPEECFTCQGWVVNDFVDIYSSELYNNEKSFEDFILGLGGKRIWYKPWTWLRRTNGFTYWPMQGANSDMVDDDTK